MTDNQTIEDVAFSIRKAMRGIGADEKKVCPFVCIKL